MIEDYAENVRSLVHRASGGRTVEIVMFDFVGSTRTEVGRITVPCDIAQTTEMLDTGGAVDRTYLVLAGMDFEDAYSLGAIPRIPRVSDEYTYQEHLGEIEDGNIQKIVKESLGTKLACLKIQVGP